MRQNRFPSTKDDIRLHAVTREWKFHLSKYKFHLRTSSVKKTVWKNFIFFKIPLQNLLTDLIPFILYSRGGSSWHCGKDSGSDISYNRNFKYFPIKFPQTADSTRKVMLLDLASMWFTCNPSTTGANGFFHVLHLPTACLLANHVTLDFHELSDVPPWASSCSTAIGQEVFCDSGLFFPHSVRLTWLCTNEGKVCAREKKEQQVYDKSHYGGHSFPTSAERNFVRGALETSEGQRSSFWDSGNSDGKKIQSVAQVCPPLFPSFTPVFHSFSRKTLTTLYTWKS